MFLAPTLTIDLSAIVANWKLLRSNFTGEECAAVVKADAYGLGMVPVATALAAAGCHTFFVATLDEGIALRAALTDVRILVFHGVQAGEEFAFVAHRLIPVLNSPAQITRWKLVATEHPHVVSALHIDTAMARLGLQPDEFNACIQKDSTLLETCRVGLLLSHLACASEPNHPLNASQLGLLRDAVTLAPGIPVSLCNSGGIFLGPDYHFHLARPGCALYGIAPFELPLPSRERVGVRGPASGTPSALPNIGPLTQPSPARGEGFNPMRQVATWDVPILMTRTLAHEQTIGYGATAIAARGTRIATVASGYADGYLRQLSHRGVAYVGEHRIPLIGRVTMDMLCFDVTSVPESLTADGMPITLLGDREGIRVDDLATAADTIGYEVLTRIGPRVARRYI